MVSVPVVVLLLAAALVVLTASAAAAQSSQLGGKLRAGDRVLVPAGETVAGDLYATGGLVRVDGTVDGDLLASAAQVIVSGEVTGDVMAAGGTVDLSGRVGGDVRAAGGQVAITGPVAEDVFVAGGQVTLGPAAAVGQDLVFGAGSMTVDGPVSGDILGSSGAYERRGTVGGSETVTIEQPEERVPTLAQRSLAAAQRVVGIMLVAALVLWLAPRLIDAPADTLRRRFLPSLGVGLLGLVGFVVVVIGIILGAVLLATALGFLGLGALVGAVVFALVLTLVVLGFALFLALTFGAPITVGAVLGDLVIPAGGAVRRWLSILLGVLVVVALSAIPIVGGWVAFLVAVLGFGALLLAVRRPQATAVTDAALDVR